MRSRWMTRRAIGFHLLLAVVVPLCLVAFWWQLHQALDGNSLSWAYTVEWPFFALIAVIGWWQLVHEDSVERAARAERAGRSVAHLEGRESEGPGVGAVPAIWSEAAAVRGESGEVAEDYVARVAAAAAAEYRDHLDRLAENDPLSAWHHAGGTSGSPS